MKEACKQGTWKWSDMSQRIGMGAVQSPYHASSAHKSRVLIAVSCNAVESGIVYFLCFNARNFTTCIWFVCEKKYNRLQEPVTRVHIGDHMKRV